MSNSSEILDFYTQPSGVSCADRHAGRLSALPRDMGALVHIIQGLLVHEFVATDWFGVTVSDERRDEIHLRRVPDMLDRLLALDDRPLTVARPARKRLLGVCRDFALLLTAVLRAQGVPARTRCGFGRYLNPGRFEDHWVCEYFDRSQSRWILVDSQLDEVWRSKLGIDVDSLDVPRDEFLISSEAWHQCRAGQVDASKFGISKFNLHGLWFVASDLVRDAAALAKVEMLPWDVWGVQPLVQVVADEARSFFDHLAKITRTPDEALDDLRALQQSDERVRVPETVFNALRQRQEDVAVR